MKFKRIVLALIVVIFIGASPSTVRSSISVGDEYCYVVYETDSFTFNGETFVHVWDQTYYYEVQDIVDDEVYLLSYRYGISYFTMRIYGEHNYNPLDLNYPGYFMDTSDWDFHYDTWKKDYFGEEIIECTASRRTFYYKYYNENVSKNYKFDDTQGYMTIEGVDYGECTHTYELRYNKDGVRDYVKSEYEFIGSIVEDRESYELKMVDSFEAKSTGVITIIFALTLITSVMLVHRRRRLKR